MRQRPGSLRTDDVRAYRRGGPPRARAGARPGRVAGRARAHPAAVLLLLPPVIAVVTLTGLMVVGLGLVGLFLLLQVLPVIIVVAVGVGMARRRARRGALRRGAAPGTARVPARPAARPRPDLVWAGARERFHRLRADYAAFECDAMQVLRLPALADVTVPSTARFVDAFAEAQALDSDGYPGPDHGSRFVTAVDRAERAWWAAREAAQRIRLSGLDPAERAAVERVVKLLTTARDSDSEPERLAAYSRARSELAKLDRAGALHVPLPAQAGLDEAARGQLPA